MDKINNLSEIKKEIINKQLSWENYKFNNCDKSILFENWNIGNLDIKNHFYFQSLITECKGKNNEDIDFSFYEDICKTDVGIVFTGSVFDGILTKINRKYYDKDNAKKIKKYNEFVNRIHATGTKIFLSIRPDLGRGISNNYFGREICLSASFNKMYSEKCGTCFRISDGKCNEIIDNICDISEFSYKAKFDGVLIDCSCYNILGEMNSEEFNRRVFGYFSNKNEMLIKTIKNIVSKNNEQIVFVKITLQTMFYEIYGNDLKKMNSLKHINLKETNIVTNLIELIRAGVDGFVFEMGSYETEFLSEFNEFQASCIFYEFYKAVTDEIKKENVKNKFNGDIVIFYKDNFDDICEMTKYVKNNANGSIDVTRNILSDKGFVRKIKTQKTFKKCIKCGYCDKISQNFNKNECLINPELNYILNKVNILHDKNIAVIGSGISGIITSLTLANRGYCVDLYEKENEINPLGKICSVWKNDRYFYDYIIFLEEKLKYFAKNNKINIYLNNTFLARKEDNSRYQTIVVATGFHEKFLNVNGAILKNVKSLYDVLNQKTFTPEKKKFIIYAKSELSLKFALYLLSGNNMVTLLINDLMLFKNLSNAKKTYYCYILKKLKANIIMFSKIKKIEEDSVELIVNKKLSKYSLYDFVMNHKTKESFSYIPQSKTIDQDMFIYEPEIYPNNKLFYDLVKCGYPGELFMVGNALDIMGLADVIKSAYFVGNNI